MLTSILILLGSVLSACTLSNVEDKETAEVAQVVETQLPVIATEPPTETPAPTKTVEPTATLSNTSTPTSEPSATPTVTKEPTNTHTPSPEATLTPTSTPVAEDTPTPKATLPSALPAQSAHTFPETRIKPFDRDDFTNYLGRVRDSFRSFASEMKLMQETDKYGDCGSFIGWTRLSIIETPGYTEVPAAWSSLYVEYRSLLRQVVEITREIRTLCDAKGGEIAEETTQTIVEFLSWAYPRTEDMVLEAINLPRQ